MGRQQHQLRRLVKQQEGQPRSTRLAPSTSKWLLNTEDFDINILEYKLSKANKSQRHKRFSQGEKAEGRISSQANIGRYGLSVIRNVEAPDMEEIIRAVTSSRLGDFVLRRRNEGGERPPGVSLLEVNEVTKQRVLGSIATQEAINTLYNSVGSLRRTMELHPERFSLIGRGFSPTISIAIMFNKESTEKLTDEREEILSALESMAFPASEFSWLNPMTPHLTLARMSAMRQQAEDRAALSELHEVLPTKIILKRAIFYSPYLHH